MIGYWVSLAIASLLCWVGVDLLRDSIALAVRRFPVRRWLADGISGLAILGIGMVLMIYAMFGIAQ